MNKDKIVFEEIEANIPWKVMRAKVPGGWLLICIDDVLKDTQRGNNESGYEWRSHPVFIPETGHRWIL